MNIGYGREIAYSIGNHSLQRIMRVECFEVLPDKLNKIVK